MKYLYGPLKSRRLGLSLGINLTFPKTCSFNCLYCQLGNTINLTLARAEYVKIEDVLNEIKDFFLFYQNAALDYITLSGLGEPTLNSRISELISYLKEKTITKVALITNSSLFVNPSFCQEVLKTDVILPSLDAVRQDIFERINRPYKKIKVEEIIQGLISLRQEFKGKIWLEVMLIKGINDDIRHIHRLKEVVDEINPDKIHLNSPVRITTEEAIFAVSKTKLRKIKEILGEKAEII